MTVERIRYEVGGRSYLGALVWNEKVQGKRPLLLMAPNWLGVTPEAIKRTEMMAGDRFVGFCADMYGDGKTVAGPPESLALADAVRNDPLERRRRIIGALDTLTREATARGIGDATKRAAAGFCFGGGNVLELARAGADVAAVIALHADLTTPMPATTKGQIKCPVPIIHGAKDPVVPKADRDAVESEMEAVGANWQMLTFGGLVHSFAEEESMVPGIAEFNAAAARQCYSMIGRYIEDGFAGRL
jgi:dienelactone hydrolase